MAKNTIPTMASYGTGKFLAEFLTGAFASLVFKYYETEIGLPAGLVALAIVLYSVWNALNDPLIGFITSRPTRLTGRHGRRFPWIVAGSFTCALAFVLIFAPPAASSGVVFLWLLISICLYDALYSTWEVNYQSVFPDKFREDAPRAKAAGIATLVGVLGVAGGAVLPTFFVRYGQPGTYLKNAFIFAAVSVAAAALMLPGVRESPDMIARYLAQEAGRKEKTSLKAQLKEAFSSRNFLAFIILYFFYQSAAISMTASIHYVGDYLLGGRSTTLIFAGMLAGALAGIPLWLAMRKRVPSNQRLLAMSAMGLAVFCLPLMLVTGYYGFVAAMFAWGLSFGGFWMLMTPAMADVIDEIVVTTKKRDDGVYIGFRAFAGRLAYAVQAVSFWIVHSLTDFAQSPRAPKAQFGIRLHTALIPALLLLVGVAIFLKMNTLNAEKAEDNRKAMKKLGL
ncbi:MAG TPA: MFS transporter [Rectinemataceae bacterium]|nr:MFS transporter [Rectinemataceae bacterium]